MVQKLDTKVLNVISDKNKKKQKYVYVYYFAQAFNAKSNHCNEIAKPFLKISSSHFETLTSLLIHLA